MKSSRAAVQRSATLTGQDADDWCESAGYHVNSLAPLRIYLDAVEGPDLRIARWWHSGTTLRRDAATPGRVLLLLQVDGSIAIETPVWSANVGPGTIVVLPIVQDAMLVASAPGAHLEIEVVAGQLPESTQLAYQDGGLLPEAARPFANVLIAALNAAFNGEISPEDAGFPAFQLALRSLLASVLSVGFSGESTGSSRKAILRENARNVINSCAARQDFSVEVLCRNLGISPRYLQEIFAEERTTPAAEIRARRATLARELRNSQDRTLNADDIARLSGFGSASSMRRALAGTVATGRSA
ncbi:helix-turn-helix domain-containing protein [Rathayibacter toxicus]|uniref:helix-turn-helix domain-containing protein n=1 Tax=Rathayibacter toxicus TaxID=145458 RepID=UPI001C04A145|nr:helix-turn-helix domain-containing protein [Rathayibacter toxicus]QWL30948.1 helix-turn-helix domain-containing protein [Rathayibacter toxicus]